MKLDEFANFLKLFFSRLEDIQQLLYMPLALPIQDLEIRLQLQLVDTMLIKLPLGKNMP